MTQTAPSNLEKLFAIVRKVHEQRATGRLICSTKRVRVILFFYRGQLLWLTDDRDHRIRRWLRVTKGIMSQQHREQVPEKLANKNLWESQNLSRQISEGNLALEEAFGVFTRAAVEALFAIGSTEQMFRHWRAERDLSGAEGVGDGLLTIPHNVFREALNETLLLQKEWSAVGLPAERSYDALVLNKEKFEAASGQGSTLLSMRKLFSGQRNFWDLLHHFSESPTVAVRLLQHFVQQEILTFRHLGDRQLSNLKATESKARVATVLCVDDSIQSAELVKQQCQLKGLKAVVCNDPLKALPMALEHQPDLILLDVVMPIVNGHELCAQLRRVKNLSAVPIVMLTGQGGLGDRVRSKIVKASGFVSKPLTTQKLQTVIDQHISQVVDDSDSPALAPGLVLGHA